MKNVSFRSSALSLELSPDTRGYVLFTLKTANLKGEFDQPDSPEVLTCEYLVDLLNVTVAAMQWIETNCDHITEADTHLYYKFRDEGTPAPAVLAPTRKRWWQR
jgi:hypothetical protein